MVDNKTPPYITTRQDLANSAAERWKQQYSEDGEWLGNTGDTTQERIYISLLALGDNPNPDEIDKIIGNESWTNITCSQCGKYNGTVVTVGQPHDYESETADLCLSCFRDVKLLVKEHIRGV